MIEEDGKEVPYSYGTTVSKTVVVNIVEFCNKVIGAVKAFQTSYGPLSLKGRCAIDDLFDNYDT